MKILLIGDTHGYYLPEIWKYAEKIIPDIILHVGDIGMYRGLFAWESLRYGFKEFPVMTYAVHGNHEDIQECERLWHGKLSLINFSLFPEFGEFRKILVDNEEINIFGFGGAITPTAVSQDGVIPFSDNDANTALSRWQETGEPKVDILLTHEAPNHIGPIGDARFGNPYTGGSQGIRDLWKAIQPRFLICGHHHRRYDYEEDGLRVKILPELYESATLLDTEDWRFYPINLEEKEEEKR